MAKNTENEFQIVIDSFFKTWASQVLSDADDYRYPERSNTRTEILPAEVPSDLASLCTRASRALNLSVASHRSVYCSQNDSILKDP
jgi:hypothetical protein